MELYFQEKLSLNGKVEITDAEENVIYSGKRSLLTGKLILKDKDGKKLVTIFENTSLFGKIVAIFTGRTFVIKKGFKTVAKIKSKISFINQKFRVKKLDWDITGNFTALEYKIVKGEEPIAEIKRKKLVSLLEGYAIDIHDEEKVAEVLAVALVLNQILKDKKKNLVSKITN